jgi:hypothetical protein
MMIDAGAAIPVPPTWISWLEQGWHGVRAADWVDGYMYPKLRSDLAFLDTLKSGALGRAAQRLRRDAVERLLRFQHMMPWDSSRRPQFFRELALGGAPLADKEHPFPIGQLKSLVLMALDEDADVAEAERRLLFAWLCPTVRCTSATHRELSRGQNRWCRDFDRPLSRYSGIRLVAWDGVEIRPDEYKLEDLFASLSRIEPLAPLVARLSEMRLPNFEQERAYTASTTCR